MTSEQMLAEIERLRAELAEERGERRRLSETLRIMVEAQVQRDSAEAVRKTVRRARNDRYRDNETSHETPTETSRAPSPPLDGAPPLPAPISPPPLSSPQPLSSGVSASAAGGQKPLFDAPRPPRPDPEALRGVWNDIAVPLGHQRWEAMSDTRKKAARLALEAVPDAGRWSAWLRHELQRPFFRGENDTGWKADVDWFLRAKTRDLVRDFDPAVAAQSAKTPSGGDRPRLPPREAPPEPTTPAAPPRRVVL